MEHRDLEKMVECHYKGAVIYIDADLFTRMTMRQKICNRKYIRYKEAPDIYGVRLSTFKRILRDIKDDIVCYPTGEKGGVALINVEKLDEYIDYFTVKANQMR
ncbi:MAG: hypothetical protein IJ691_10840 [Lachnospiraceae bacterium]|nr:hypothetical protein [Lachnospiraceae bacterium]